MKRNKRYLIDFLRGFRKGLKRWTHGLQRLDANFLYEYRNRNRTCSNPPPDTRLGWRPDSNVSFIAFNVRLDLDNHDLSESCEMSLAFFYLCVLQLQLQGCNKNEVKREI